MSVQAISESIQARLRQHLIADRVAAGQPALVEMVYSHRDYAAVPEDVMVFPSAAVVYAGYTPLQTPGNVASTAGIQQLGFQFLVVINVSNAGDTGTGEGVQDEVSPLFDACLDALLGFRPIPKFTPLKLDPAPGAAVSDAGFGYYPLAFTTAATYRGNP